jgi:hypothetical protein
LANVAAGSMSKTRELIGYVGVDSGTVAVLDPCNAGDLAKAPWPELGQMNYPMGHPGLAVVSATRSGDGYFPVYAETDDDGQIVSVVIVFDRGAA